jgi:hypothetical protein
MKKITFADIFKRFKGKVGVSKDYKVADLLGFKQSTFSQRKKDGSIPYEELVSYCQKHAVSLDELFNVKKTKALDFLSEDERKYADKTIKALRNHKTALAVKANLDALSEIPMDVVAEKPESNIKCLVCQKDIEDGDAVAHQLASPECNLRNQTHILRLEKEVKDLKTLGQKISVDSSL